MARRGWVAAEVEPGVWKRLSVFDDGWIELSGFARSFSDTRSQARETLVSLAAVVALFLAIPLVNFVPGVPTIVSSLVGFAAVFGALFLLFRLRFRTRTTNSRQLAADAAQAKRERDAGERIRRAPGAPLFRRASSAAQFAAWIEGEVHVEATRIHRVRVETDPVEHIVAVDFEDGTTRTYRSPDKTLPRLLLPFDRG